MQLLGLFYVFSVVIMEICEKVTVSASLHAKVCKTELERRCLPFICLSFIILVIMRKFLFTEDEMCFKSYPLSVENVGLYAIL